MVDGRGRCGGPCRIAREPAPTDEATGVEEVHGTQEICQRPPRANSLARMHGAAGANRGDFRLTVRGGAAVDEEPENALEWVYGMRSRFLPETRSVIRFPREK